MMVRMCDWWRSLGLIVGVLALITATTACEKEPRQKLLEAKTNLTRETKLEASENLLREVLDSQPDNLEAKRLLGELYQLRGEYKRAEEQLVKLWNAHDFDDQQAARSASLKSTRELLRTQLVELYKAWATHLDPTQQAEKFVEVVGRGLDYDAKDMDLNQMLVDYYWNRGQRLVDAGKKMKAAEAFEQIEKLRTMRGDDRRKRARLKARKLRLEFFKDEGRKRFENRGREVIAKLEGLTLGEEGEAIRINSKEDIDYRLEPDKEQDTKKARQIAHIGLVEKLRALAIVLADLPDQADLGKLGNERAKEILWSKLEIEERNFRPGRYTIEGRLGVEEAIEMAYDLKTAWEKLQRESETAESGRDSGASGKPDAGNRPDGSSQ